MANAQQIQEVAPIEVAGHVVKYDVTEQQIQELRSRFSGTVLP